MSGHPQGDFRPLPFVGGVCQRKDFRLLAFVDRRGNGALKRARLDRHAKRGQAPVRRPASSPFVGQGETLSLRGEEVGLRERGSRARL